MLDPTPTVHKLPVATPVTSALPADLEAHIVKLKDIDRQVTALARWMDNYGIDAGAGFFLPGVGDVLTSGVKIWLFTKASEAGLPAGARAKIAGWAVFDLTLGLVPIAGDVVDLVFRSNVMSARLVHEHIEQRLALIEAARRKASGESDQEPVEHTAYSELRRNLAA